MSKPDFICDYVESLVYDFKTGHLKRTRSARDALSNTI